MEARYIPPRRWRDRTPRHYPWPALTAAVVMGHLVIASITTIKILTVAPELRSGRAWVRSKRLVIWKNDGLLRL